GKHRLFNKGNFMSLITKEEVLRVERMARIALTEEEVVAMQARLEGVLSYAARVQDLSAQALANEDFVMQKNSNVEREDVIVACDPHSILAQAPEHEGGYFVVPAIIETNE